MRRIIKDEEPEFWKSFKRNNPRIIIYKQLDASEKGRQVRSDIKQHMIEHQKYLCAYCCRSIDSDSSHNEHIKPEMTYNTLTMDYNNLVASCSTTESCGMYKGHDYNETLFVSPLHEDCEIHFEFMPDGTILGKTPAGKHTVDALKYNNFNSKLITQQAPFWCLLCLCILFITSYTKSEILTRPQNYPFR